jgi:diguanylate cyclase (GGDEF)-like protein/PAS domain S-box-containing protein
LGFPASVTAVARRCAGFALAALCMAGATHAAARDYYFDRAIGDNGLAQRTVTALAQDDAGFVWVGTQGGLHRFDGQHYTLFREDARQPEGLPDSFITSLSSDHAGGLWVGTYAHSVVRLDLANGRVRRYEPASRTDDRWRQVLAVLATPDAVWIGSPAGLERLDPASGQRRHVVVLPRSATPPAISLRQALVRDARGVLWYGTDAGLYRIDPRTGSSTRVSDLPLRTALRDRSGRVWLGGDGGLYLLRDPTIDARAVQRVWPREGERGGSVRAIAQSPDGRIWLAIANAGLRRLDPATGDSLALRQNDSLPGALPEDGVNALMVDRAGLLWVGGQIHGAAVTDPAGARFRLITDLEHPDSIRAIWQGPDHQLWLGTDSPRLLRYDQQAHSFLDLTRLLPAGEEAGTRVMGFADPGDGRPWLATSRGLFRLDPRTPALQPMPLPGHPGVALRSIALAADGRLWLGTNDRGLLGFDPAHPEQLTHIGFHEGDPRGLSHPTVHALLVARDGRIWIGTGHGLAILDPRNGRVAHFGSGDGLAGDIVRALWQTADGAVWIGTHSGLNRATRSAGGALRFEQPLLQAAPGEPMPVVYSVLADPGGRLWLGTDRGLLRFDPRTRALRRYSPADGLQELEFNGGAAAVLAGGRFAFGGVNGLNTFDPMHVADSTYQPPLRLLDVQAGGDARALRPVWAMRALELPEAAGLLRLRIGALDYLGNAGIRYRYRIDGLDRDWIDNGARSEITYTLLPAGHYVFRAQSTNHDGIWSPRELRIPLVVTPPAWRSPLALAAYALAALLLLAFALWRWRVRRARERGYFARIRDREERLKLALWASGDYFWDYDLAHDRVLRMRARDDVRSASDIEVETELQKDHRIHPEDAPQVRERLRGHLRGESALFLSEHRVMEDGQWAWMRVRGRVVERDAAGRAVRVAGTARNVSNSRQAERERRIAAEVLRSMSEAVSVLDRHFVFVSVNPAFTRTTGYSDAEILGRNGNLLDSAQHDPAFYRQVREHLERHGRWSGEMWQQRKDGEEFLCAYECTAVLDANGQHQLYVAVLSDITDQKRAEQELRYLANYDTLTNLPNRTLLAERLSRAIVRARRHDDHIAVLFLDLDRFKDINDSLGHAAGDRILRAAAVRLQETVGPQHTVARLGGDEFTVVLENIASAEDADRIAREIIMAFEAPLLTDDRQEVAISPSIGISLYPDHAQVPTELLKQADTAMYQAKAAGRRTFVRYTESMDVSIRRRATITGALRKVLDRGELRVAYQPRLALASNRIVGVEALLRWHSPEHGDIPPSQFIPLAEEAGLILEIGEWVLREACVTLRRWHEHGLGDLRMAVNVSALQLLRGDLPAVVERVLAETGLPPPALELELTESVIMANAEQTAGTLQAFRRLGISLAIDDFGTGYSSLAYLKRLPINTLKVDKEFIDDLSLGSEDAAITTTIIAMARALGLNVVAEGVETAAQVQFLREHECDEIQGFWLSEPLEASRCLALIRNWSPSTGQPTAALSLL